MSNDDRKRDIITCRIIIVILIVFIFDSFYILYKDKNNNQQNDDSTITQSDSKLKLIPKVTEDTKSPYDVTIQFYSESGIAIKKLYKPEKSNELDTADLKTIRDTIVSNGTDIFGETFEVSENGVYWLYIQEISGEEYTQRFIIENFQ